MIVSALNQHDISKKTALKFVILLSVASLFADMTYEGYTNVVKPATGSQWTVQITLDFLFPDNKTNSLQHNF
jgi:hypothetical protein